MGLREGLHDGSSMRHELDPASSTTSLLRCEMGTAGRIAGRERALDTLLQVSGEG
jgi:hypothetical protein